jgi:hypothetical protein
MLKMSKREVFNYLMNGGVIKYNKRDKKYYKVENDTTTLLYARHINDMLKYDIINISREQDTNSMCDIVLKTRELNVNQIVLLDKPAKKKMLC